MPNIKILNWKCPVAYSWKQKLIGDISRGFGYVTGRLSVFLLLYFLLPSLSLFVCCCSDRVKVFKIWKTRKGLLKNFLTSLCLVLDLDECATNSHICDVNAVCQNTAGSHTCSCKAGYTGNGKTCHGKLENERENARYRKVCRFSL